jgi:hypothetical protein
MAELNIYACQNSECNHIGEYRGTENPPDVCPRIGCDGDFKQE